MDTPDPVSQDDLNRLERRLADWTPPTPVLSRDRLLFEAGRASARSSSLRVLTLGSAVLAVALGAWGLREHSQRRALELALAEKAHALDLARAQPAAPVVTVVRLPDLTPAPDSYFALSHRLATLGPDEIRASAVPSHHALPPANPSEVLTPLNARRAGEFTDL
jgi:hypothetical protein